MWGLLGRNLGQAFFLGIFSRMLTPDEKQMLEEKMQSLLPGYQMFDIKTMRAAVKLATTDEKNLADPTLFTGPDMSLSRLIVKVCRDPKREGYGVPHVWWWLQLLYLVYPDMSADPWLEVKWWEWATLQGKRKCLTMWGSQNSSKSAFMSSFSTLQMIVWGSQSYVYVAGPVKGHTTDKVISDIFKLIRKLDRLKSVSPSVAELRLKTLVTKDSCYIEGQAGRAECSFVSLDSASAIQGKKTEMHEHTGIIGCTILIVDEFIENPYLQLKEGISNLRSNANFFGMLACNPKPDKVQHPSLRTFSWPTEAANLRRDTAFRWKTSWGTCMRFAWSNCPNNYLGRAEWPYLLDQARMEVQKDTNEEAIIAAQVDAWGFGSGQRNAPLDEAGIRLAGSYTEPIWTGPVERVCAFDCSFGGTDPAGVCILEAGSVLRQGKLGEGIERRVFAAVDQFEFLVEDDFRATQEWINEIEEIFAYTGGGWPETEQFQQVRAGQFMGASWDMAKKAGDIIMQYQVPPANVTFDASQRADCSDAMMAVLGRKNIRWWYEGSRSIRDEEQLGLGDWFYFPYRYEKDVNQEKKPVLWSDMVSETSSMIWFMACEMVKAGYLTNGATVQKGLDELCARPIVRGRKGQGTGKKDVMGKVAMKSMGMRSPMYAETLAMAIYLGTRFLGLVDLKKPSWLTTSVTQKLPEGMRDIIQTRPSRRPGGRYTPAPKINQNPTNTMHWMNLASKGIA